MGGVHTQETVPWKLAFESRNPFPPSVPSVPSSCGSGSEHSRLVHGIPASLLPLCSPSIHACCFTTELKQQQGYFWSHFVKLERSTLRFVFFFKSPTAPSKVTLFQITIPCIYIALSSELSAHRYSLEVHTAEGGSGKIKTPWT